MDGKSFAENEMIIALGVTLSGQKMVLGAIETGTENGQVCRDFLTRLQERGLQSEEKILFVIDGAKGLRKGIETVFGKQAIIQRCQWHKRENVVAYLGFAEKVALQTRSFRLMRFCLRRLSDFVLRTCFRVIASPVFGLRT